MKTTSKLLMASMLLTGLVAASCSKNDNSGSKTPDTDQDQLKKSKYVFVYSGIGSAGNSGTYIVTADDVTKGKITSTNNGVETDAYTFIVQNNTVFAQAYNAQGPVTPFRLNEEGKVASAGRVVTTFRTGVYGTVNKDAWVGGSDPRSNGVGELFLFDAVNLKLNGKSTTDMQKITQTGENAVWTGLFQVDNKLYMPYYKFKPAGNGAPVWQGKYGSLDSTWVAVFSYPGLQYERTISDDRTGFIGNWFSMQGLQQIENGDVYAWSAAPEINDIKSKKPSGMIRIKKGAEQFDKTWFLNMEEIAKTKIARAQYIANGKFLMSLYASAQTGDVSGGRIKLAIVDVNNKSVKYVANVPEHAQADFKLQTYYEGDGKTINYVLQDDSKQFYVYVINAETATAVKGLHIEGASNVSSFSKLKY